MNIDFKLLKANGQSIAILATISVITSTLLMGAFLYYLAPILGTQLPLLYCLLFGALISPTDPIAVLTTFKKLNAPKKLNVIIAGESLFNDGVGIVVFLTLYHLAVKHEPITWQHVSFLFLSQAIGGILYGALLGITGHRLMKGLPVRLALLITFAITTGGYALAQSIGLSGPLAMVVAGIFIGNKARKGSKESEVNNTLHHIWELIDEVLNSILFMLLGLEILHLHSTHTSFIIAILCIPVTLFVRFITVAGPVHFLFSRRQRPKHINRILTWGGLRGGLAVALALSLPESTYRDLILIMTFAIVAFAVIVQGTTIQKLLPSSR